MRKPVAGPVSAGANCSPLDERFAKDYPMLSEHLGHDYWEDGSARQPSTLTVFMEDGRFKVCLNDREVGASLFMSGDTLPKALASLEKALNASGGSDWRPWKKRRGK